MNGAASALTADPSAQERTARRVALGAVAGVAALSFFYCYGYALLAGTDANAATSLFWVVADWAVWLLLAPPLVRVVLQQREATRRQAAARTAGWIAACVVLALAVRAAFELAAGTAPLAFLLFKRLPLYIACAGAIAACAFWQVRPRLVMPLPAPPAPSPVPGLLVQSARGEHRLPLADIAYVEACGNYLEVRGPDGAYLMRQTMKALEEQLAGSALVRCHRSYFVNLDQIDKLAFRDSGNHVLMLRCGAAVPVSKAYRDAVRAALGA